MDALNIANKTINELPEKPGVYRLYQRRSNGDLKLLYIGRTKNLRSRLFNHDVCFDEFTYERIDSAERRKSLEKYLIHEFEPPFNQHHNPSPHTFDTGSEDTSEEEKEEDTESDEVSQLAEELLASVNEEPFLSLSERYNLIEVGKKDGTAAKKELLERNLVKQVEVRTGKIGRNPKMLDITSEGKQRLKDLGYDVKKTGRAGVEHRYWQKQIKEYYEEKGYTAEIEHRNGWDSIDVYASNDEEEIAVEVACSIKHQVRNIKKCLKYDVDSIQIVCPRDIMAEEIRVEVLKEMDRVPRLVEFVSLSTFT